MIRPACLALALLLCLGFVLPSPVFAGDEETPVPGPRNLEPEDEEPAPAPKPEAKPATRPVDPACVELLPLDDVERLKLAREHPTFATRLTVLTNRGKKLQRQLAQRKNKNDDGAKKLQKQIDQISMQIGRLMAAAEGTLAEFGVTREIFDLVETAPSDGHYRVQRYAHSVVLSLELDDAQRALFDRVIDEVNGATYALAAQKKRLALALKQSEVEKDKSNAIRRTFDQQLNWNDRRFWMLVDYVLTDDQRHALKERLPTSYQRIQNGLEHLYQIEGITPSQGARATAIVTEYEAEAAPDQALLKKNRARLQGKDVKGKERKALRTEMAEANKRLQDLQLGMARAFKTVLTEDQIRLYKAIPPRLSHVDRRRNFNYVFEGMPFDAAQRSQLNQFRREYQAERKAMQRELAEIRRKSADYGADSPQMGMMEMEMAGVAARGYTLQRTAIGRVFLEVLTPDQVSGWVLGYYGRVR